MATEEDPQTGNKGDGNAAQETQEEKIVMEALQEGKGD